MRDGSGSVGRESALIVLPPQPASPRDARQFVRHVLAAVAIGGDVVEVTVLLVSELVTNAVCHAQSDTTVRVCCRSRRVRVEVSDASSAAPHVHHGAMLEEGGRGLMLVERLADRWGYDLADGGKVVWFELQRAG